MGGSISPFHFSTSSRIAAPSGFSLEIGGVICPTFTTASGAMTFTPASGSGFTVVLAGTHATVTNTRTTTALSYGLIAELDMTLSSGNVAESFGFGATLRFRGSAGNTAGVKGVNAMTANCFVYNIGTVDNAGGWYCDVRNLGAGTVGSLYGIRIPACLNSGGGTVATCYGLQITAQTVGATNWGVHVGGNSYFDSKIGIGVTPTRTVSMKAGASTTLAQVGGVIFEHVADATVGGTEADIFTNTLAASILGTDKDKIAALYSGQFVTVGTELTQLKVYFAGTAIWDSTAVAPATGTNYWAVSVDIIRVSSTVVRYTVRLNTNGASGYSYCKSDELTGLTLSATNILKITGTSSGVGSGSGDIVGKMGYGEWKSAA